MKKIILSMIVVATICFSSLGLANTASTASVGVVDVSALIQQTGIEKTIVNNIQKQFSSRRTDLLKKASGLESMVKDYQKNQAVLTDAQKKTKQQAIRNFQLNLQKEQSQLQQDVATAQSQQMKSYMGKIKNAVSEVASAKKITLVLPDNLVLYANNSQDITADVVAKLK